MGGSVADLKKHQTPDVLLMNDFYDFFFFKAYFPLFPTFGTVSKNISLVSRHQSRP